MKFSALEGTDIELPPPLQPPPLLIATIKFRFIITVVHRWADKFCLHCNIFIYIRHIWIKPVLCSHMISLFHHTSPWTHRCLQFSPSALRNGRVFRRSVQTACCYWIPNRGKVPPIEIHRRTQAVYGDQCVDVSAVRRWVRRFKDGEQEQADLSDKTRSGRPVMDFKTSTKLTEVYWSAWWFCRKIIMQLWKWLM